MTHFFLMLARALGGCKRWLGRVVDVSAAAGLFSQRVIAPISNL